MTLAAVAAGLRAATLTAWSAHPVRFREDANAEEDHAAGWYRDRVVVELAQNAADAGPGVLLLRLDTAAATLVAANTGHPLTAAGLTSMAALRASAKAPGQGVGRFGVGFAAVRSVADEIGVVSTSGAVHFSVGRTAAAVATDPALAAEAGRRGSALPALRLPFDGPGPADAGLLAEGWDTAVVLRLRDRAAVDEVRAQLAALDDALLLALGLTRVRVEVDGVARELADVADRWLVVTATGAHDPALLAGRPVEEREHAGWRLSWAVPRGPATVRPVLHAPTPTDDPTTVPALLIGTFPLDAGRRRVTPGAVTDALVAEAGRLWPALLTACRTARAQGEPAPAPLDLLPTGFPAGPLDAALRESVLAATRTAPVLATVDGWVAPAEALVLRPPWDATAAAVVLGRRFDRLAVVGVEHRDALRALGVASVGLGDLADQLPADDPAWLREVYDLVGADPEELGGAPVPLRDGRVVHGARGTVVVEALPASAGPALDALASWGLRVVHPDAVHPVLERLGAQRLDAAGLAAHPLLRDRVLDGESADVLLALVAAAGDASGPSWWGEVLLDADDGEPTPARGLVRPGSPAAGWFDPEVMPPVAAQVLDRWGGAVLERLGVRAGLVVERVDDLVADALEDWVEYLEATGAVDDGDLLAVTDLDAVADWPAVLRAIAARPDALAPVRAEDGRAVPTYLVWRLRAEPALGAARPFALPGADDVGLPAHLGVAPAALAGAGEALARALGGIRHATELDAEAWLTVLDDLVEGAEVPLDLAVDCWRALARLADPVLGDAELLPGWDGTRAVAVPTDALAVADPMWVRHPGVVPVLPVPFGSGLAELLDLPDAADRAPGRVAAGTPRPVPPQARLVPGVPAGYLHHDRLLVDGHRLAWWVTDGALHATTDGLAEGLAAVAGWAHRHRLAAVLADPAARTGALLDLAGE